MSEARIYVVPNPLAGVLAAADAPTTESLLSEAGERVASLSRGIETFVADRVARLASWPGEPDVALLAGREAIAEAALDVAELAEAAGMPEAGSVARGLYVLAGEPAGRPSRQADALRVHLRALVFVHELGRGPGTEAPGLVEELRRLRASLGLTE